jgi:hypothetical protein
MQIVKILKKIKKYKEKKMLLISTSVGHKIQGSSVKI